MAACEISTSIEESTVTRTQRWLLIFLYDHSIQQDATQRQQWRASLGILLLETEDDLGRDYPAIWILEAEVRVERKARGVFEYVRRDWFVLHGVLHGTLLVHAQGGQAIEDPRVNVLPPIGNDTDDHLGKAKSAPSLAVGPAHTFFQLPGPHTELFFRAVKWLIFFMTP